MPMIYSLKDYESRNINDTFQILYTRLSIKYPNKSDSWKIERVHAMMVDKIKNEFKNSINDKIETNIIIRTRYHMFMIIRKEMNKTLDVLYNKTIDKYNPKIQGEADLIYLLTKEVVYSYIEQALDKVIGNRKARNIHSIELDTEEEIFYRILPKIFHAFEVEYTRTSKKVSKKFADKNDYLLIRYAEKPLIDVIKNALKEAEQHEIEIKKHNTDEFIESIVDEADQTFTTLLLQKHMTAEEIDTTTVCDYVAEDVLVAVEHALEYLNK